MYCEHCDEFQFQTKVDENETHELYECECCGEYNSFKK